MCRNRWQHALGVIGNKEMVRRVLAGKALPGELYPHGLAAGRVGGPAKAQARRKALGEATLCFLRPAGRGAWHVILGRATPCSSALSDADSAKARFSLDGRRLLQYLRGKAGAGDHAFGKREVASCPRSPAPGSS
jgi:hypothetical protein